jgi:hypothetical protein
VRALQLWLTQSSSRVPLALRACWVSVKFTVLGAVLLAWDLHGNTLPLEHEGFWLLGWLQQWTWISY